MTMADATPAAKPASHPAHTSPTPLTPLERIRYIPEWETPINPPKRSRFTSSKVSRTVKRSRLAAAFTPKPRSVSTTPLTPASASSIHKESSSILTGNSYLPTARSTYSTKTSRSRLDSILPPNRHYLWGLTRATCIFLIVFLFIILTGLALGLGLGLGLRKKHDTTLPLPDGSGRAYDGNLTFFTPGLGACGMNNTETENVVAVAWEVFDAAGPNEAAGGNPNQNPLCGKWIRVSREGNEEGSVDVMVVDRCVGCGRTDLDLAKGAFGVLGSEEEGRIMGQWKWL